VQQFKWQDIVFMIGGFVFAPSLLVSIIGKVHIPIETTLPTAIVLTCFLVCYASMKFWLAFMSTILTAICWYKLIFI